MRRLLLLLVFALACGREPKVQTASWAAAALGPERVTLMTFNAENLFDARHDEGKDDYEFLPVRLKQAQEHKDRCAAVEADVWRERCLNMDWSEAAVAAKLKAVAGAILQENAGKGPDILVLQEVENAVIAERLRREYLVAADYGPVILIEGDDGRGIDTAILTRLEEAVSPRLHKIPFSGMTPAQARDSRGILQSAFKLPGGETLHVFALHLPAPYHPRKFREQALDYLDFLRSELPEGSLALAAGDFNITAGEDAAFGIWEGQKDWLVSHRLGCSSCKGTHYYAPKSEWSFLDAMLFSRPLHPASPAAWTVLKESLRVPTAAAGQRSRTGEPKRFDALRWEGVSDHWPLAVTLARKNVAHRPPPEAEPAAPSAYGSLNP